MKGACRMASLPSPHPHRSGCSAARWREGCEESGFPEPMTKLRLFPVEPTSTQPTQVGEWATLEIPATDFDLVALHATLETKKCQLGLTWTDVVREVSAPFQDCKPRLIRASNLRDLHDTRFGVDAEIVLLVLYRLGRSPESFVPGHPAADRPEAQLPSHGAGALPNFDLPWIHAKLDAGRSCLGLLGRRSLHILHCRHFRGCSWRVAYWWFPLLVASLRNGNILGLCSRCNGHPQPFKLLHFVLHNFIRRTPSCSLTCKHT